MPVTMEELFSTQLWPLIRPQDDYLGTFFKLKSEEMDNRLLEVIDDVYCNGKEIGSSNLPFVKKKRVSNGQEPSLYRPIY